MYTFIREVGYRNMADALRAAPINQAIVKYFKEAHGVDTRVMRAVTGSPIRARFVTQMESMDAYAAMQQKAMQDPGYQKMLAESALLVDGSKTCDEIWM